MMKFKGKKSISRFNIVIDDLAENIVIIRLSDGLLAMLTLK